MRLARGASRSVLLLGLLLSAALPASAFAVAPINDTLTGAIPLKTSFDRNAPTTLSIEPTAPLGGWSDATSTEDTASVAPTCFGSPGTHSMWYQITVPESSVLRVQLTTGDSTLYLPLITIITSTGTQSACGLGAAGLPSSQPVSAQSFVDPGTYFVRIASALPASATLGQDVLPTLQLTEWLQDVTPPDIKVAVSDTVGVGKAFTFNATGSLDHGSGIDPTSALWTFYDSGNKTTASGLLVVKARWTTPGLHRVSLELGDRAGNRITYQFNVFVHSFVPPKVGMRVLAPRPGSRTLSVVITHDMPVRVRLVVLQAGTLLRSIPSTPARGYRKGTRIDIALTQRIAAKGFVIVSGTASDLSQNPNTVALPTCSLSPGTAGGVCA